MATESNVNSLGRAALLCACALLTHAAAAQTVVRINGSGSALGGMQVLAAAFMRTNPRVKVVVQPTLGSSGSISALLGGQIELAASNRKPNDSELAKLPLVCVEYARTPFVVAVHRDLGITALSSSQLAGLYGEGATTFPNGKRARPVLRRSDASDTDLLKSFSHEIAQAVAFASERRGILNANTDSDAADLVENTAGAFAVSTLALIESEKRPFTALTIDGKVPTVANMIDGSYPYYKTLHLIVSPSAGPETKMFAAFVRSAEGRALLRANGNAPS